MGKQISYDELVSFKELLIANSIQADTLCQLMIDKGFITSEEFFIKLKEVQSQYEKRKSQC